MIKAINWEEAILWIVALFVIFSTARWLGV